MKTRYNEKQFQHLRGRMRGLFVRLVNERLTHEEFLSRRTDILECEQTQKLPSICRAELLGMSRGAVDMLHTTKLVVWAHYYEGEFISSDLFHENGFDIKAIDSSKSCYVWTGTQKVWI